MDSTLKDSLQRVRALEADQDALKNQLITRDQVDKLVTERLEQLDNGRVVGEAKNRALNLKLRSSQVSHPTQLGYRQEESAMDFESLKLDMVKELRDMK